MRFFNFFKPVSSVVGYSYSVWGNKGLVDPFAFPVMRDYYPDEFEEAMKFTKGGASSYEVQRIFEDMASGPQNDDIEISAEDQWFLDEATSKVKSMLGSWKVEPLELKDAMNRLHHDTSAGFGYRGLKKGECLDQIYEQARMVEINAMDLVPQEPIPMMLATRAIMYDWTKPKQRVTFVGASAIVVNEQKFVAPVIEKMKTIPNYPIMFGKNVIPRLSKMHNQTPFPKGSYSCELDISKMDRNLRTATIRRGVDVMENMIDFDHWKGKKLREAQKKRWMRTWFFVVYYLLHTPVMKPNGEIQFLDGAMPSGSSFTQLIESIISMIMFVFFSLKYGFGIYDLKVLGDDCKAITQGRPRQEDIAECYLRTFSAVLNTVKTKIRRADREGPEFLGYQFRNGFLYRPTMDWFKLMLHPENEVKDLATSFSRLTAYMFLGGVNDVQFIRFFEHYQGSYPLENWEFVKTRDMKAKMLYGGMNFPIKKLLEYTVDDYVMSLITFKD